jgi:hypothetical protein
MHSMPIKARPRRIDRLGLGCFGRLMLCACLVLCAPAGAEPGTEPSAKTESVRILVQNSPLAGYRHYEAPALWSSLAVGDPLSLQREPDNPYDTHAIRVEWRGHKLGYLPRAENRALAAEMDRGIPMAARISALKKGRSAWQRVRVDVFVVM